MLLDVARAFTAAGCCVVPARPDGTKAPAVRWEPYQLDLPTDHQLEVWFSAAPGMGSRYDGLGIVCGAVSGGLEMLELEGRAVQLGPRLGQLLVENGGGDLWTRLCAGYLEQSPSGGYHWLYRVDPSAGSARRNTKLARRPATAAELAENPRDKVKVLLETRGEGGFVVVAPSAGRTHSTGGSWTMLTGGPTSIPTVTADERDLLYAVASMLDQMPAADRVPAPAARDLHAASQQGRPGDDFNQHANWDDILTPHGWRRTRSTFAGTGAAWTRPGKDHGVSATTGTSADGVDRLYVFSTSTTFESERPYSKFAAFAHLEFDGDMSAAAAALREAGYGAPDDDIRPLTLSGLPPAPQSSTVPALTLINGDHPPVLSTGQVDDGAAALKLDQDGSDLPARIDVTLTDEGNARLFVTRHGPAFRYAPSRGDWLQWDGNRWRTCEDDSEAIEAARETIHAIQAGTKVERSHKTHSLSRRALEAMVALARRDARIRVLSTQLDADPLSLCTPGGVVDLSTGEVAPADPDQLNTKLTGCAPSTDRPRRWLRFLDETFSGDQETIGFVQRLAGYSATGLTNRHVLPFLHGSGGNGKSVFLDVLVTVLGDYASTAPAGFLMAGREQHETEIARLTGMRLVVCSEINQRDRFDEAKVKLLTGGDQVTARFMRQDYFTFKPTHKLWLMGNHQPRVGAGGESFWRRLRLLPFTHVVPRERRVEGLAEHLAESEGPAILGWLIQGAIEVLTGIGLAEPQSVLAATEVYAAEEDALARYIADRCLIGGGEHVRTNTADMRKAYTHWCTEEGERPVSPQVFGRELRSRFAVGDTRSNGKRFYTNIHLLADEPDEPDGSNEDGKKPRDWWNK